MMSDRRNQATLAIMSKKNDLMKKIISDTEDKIKKFANPNNKDYQDFIRNLILEVNMLYIC